MNITCSAEKGIMSTGECLKCALSGNNCCSYDYAVLKNMFGDNQQEARRNEIHVTDLTGCIRKAWYDKTCATAEYPHEMLTRWIGTKIHSAVEGSDELMDSELPVTWESLVGKSDIVYKDGRIVDIKCQPAGELVTMADGTERKIEDVHIFDQVLSWDGQRLVPARVTAIMDGGTQEVYEVRLASAQTFRASWNHPVLTDRGFISTNELTIGEDRAVVMENWIGETEIPKDDARMIGYLIGDGGTNQLYGIKFTNQDKELLADLRDICCHKGWDLTKVNPSDPTHYGYRIGMQGKKLSTTGPMAFIQKYGLHRKMSHQKTIPPDIMKGDRTTVTNFLAGYFDTDGTISDPQSVDRIPCRLSITTVSEELARQTSELLRRLGITNRIHINPVGYGERITRLVYTICVWQADMVLRFGELIPFICAKKRNRFNDWKPYLEQKFRKGGKNLRRIESVVSLGEMQTIGLEIEDTHTYITNGVITHNTTRWLMPAKVPYGSHVLQVNIYAFLLRKMGRDVTKLQIQYIDASGPSKCRACRLVVRKYEGEYRCPSCGNVIKNAHLGALLVDVPIMRDEEVLECILERKENLENAMAMGIAPEKEPGYLCGYCQHIYACAPGMTEGD